MFFTQKLSNDYTMSFSDIDPFDAENFYFAPDCSLIINITNNDTGIIDYWLPIIKNENNQLVIDKVWLSKQKLYFFIPEKLKKMVEKYLKLLVFT